MKGIKTLLALAWCVAASPAFAAPDDLVPLRDDSATPNVQEAARLLRTSLNQIRIEQPDLRRQLGLPIQRLVSEDHGNIVVVRGANGEFDIDWSNPRNMQNGLLSIIQEFYDTHPGRNPHFLSVLTSFSVDSPQAFYMPVFNDIRGIGYQHSTGTGGQETFDAVPGLSVNGIIFLNSFRNYAGRMAPLGRFIFDQELGHRWASFVYFQGQNGPSSAMLGRDCAHWSYFLSTDNSSLEGNVWHDNGDGTFTTATSFFNFGYSQLDRYLMGFAPAEAVQPWFLVWNAGQWDCSQPYRGGSYNPAWNPPVFGGAGQPQDTVRGTRVDVNIQDVIAVEGQRNPSYENSPKTWSMVFILAVRQNDTVDDNTISNLENIRRTLESQWEADATEPGYEAPNLVTTLDGSSDPALPDPPGGGGPGSVGAPCASFSDCDADVTDHCVPMGSGIHVCTHTCHASSDCPQSFCCQESVPGNDRFPSYCIQSDHACEDAQPPGGAGGAGGPGGAGGSPAMGGSGGAGGAGGMPATGGTGGDVTPTGGTGGTGGAPPVQNPDAGAPTGDDGTHVTVHKSSGSGGCAAVPGAESAPLLSLLLLGLRRRRR